MPRMTWIWKPLRVAMTAATIYAAAGGQEEHRRLTSEQWLQDLAALKKTLTEKHPNPFYRASKASFDAAAAELRERIPAMSEEQVILGFMKLVALLRDGHSNLQVFGSSFPSFKRYFPVRLYRFSDGLFITAIDKSRAEYLGRKVLGVGKATAEAASAAAASAVAVDTPSGAADFGSIYLTSAGVLKGLDLLDEAGTLTLRLENPRGVAETLTFAPQDLRDGPGSGRSPGESPWCPDLATRATGAEPPLYLRHVKDSNYWYEHLKGQRTLYMQFNSVADQKGDSFEAFNTRMWAYIDQHEKEVDRFVLDLRFNMGGNGGLVLPLVKQFIRHEALSREGHLYVLTGGRTFSAAVICCADLKRWTGAIFVGEPTAAPTNFYSDSRYTALPNSRLRLGVSSKFFDMAWPANRDRDFLPDLPAPLSSGDFFSGKDPALDMILAGDARPITEIAGAEGVDAAVAVAAKQRERAEGVPWWQPPQESRLNAAAYRALGSQIDRGIAIFQLITRLFPGSWNAWDSLGEAYVKKGSREEAIACYRKALALDPTQASPRQALEALK